MIKIRLNGADVALESTLTVTELLAARGFAGKKVAVERNGEIVPRSQHESVRVQANDTIEIVVAVGGG
jgi:sulfur carrier protein